MFPADQASGSSGRLRDAGSTYELPANTTSARLARELVRSNLAGFDVTMIEVAELLVSELVTNAVAHAQSAPTMRIDVSRQGIKVAVHDDAPGPVTVQDAADDAPGGRGLLLVDSLAASWGWAPTDMGKRVWFTL
jgi:anti-sigma regulatory factor (Ser/Thr protein kinase)